MDNAAGSLVIVIRKQGVVARSELNPVPTHNSTWPVAVKSHRFLIHGF